MAIQQTIADQHIDQAAADIATLQQKVSALEAMALNEYQIDVILANASSFNQLYPDASIPYYPYCPNCQK